MSDPYEKLVLIPSGEFQMGCDSEMDHSPVHKVRLGSFYIEKHQVTNMMYHRFCRETGHRMPAFLCMDAFRSGPEFPHHPVVGVSWQDAVAYAAWCGRRLPTEAEWEYAARGGLVGKHYSHGDELSPSAGNYDRSNLGGPAKVGSYPANGFGQHDMQGNVVEWVWDHYDADYYLSSPRVNPRGPAIARGRLEPVSFHVIRGGGWHSGPYCNRVYYRNALPANWVDFNVGVRCVSDVGSGGSLVQGEQA